MAKNWLSWGWQLGMVGCLTLSGTTFNNHPVLAQIVPDNTLGAERSAVTHLDALGIPIDQIDGGAIRGANLFHSFLEFNVEQGQGAYFINPDGIRNILSRVTGNDPSDILGTLGVLGNANLFFINPNGIIFGENASLDVQGSFIATTANAIEFGNQGVFSASTPEVPANLLTVNPSAFLFNQIVAQPIHAIEVNGATLAVPNGHSLLLVGGTVSPTSNSTGGLAIEQGVLETAGGRVELGTLSTVGTIALDFLDANGSNLQLGFPDQVPRADITLSNNSSINVAAANGGDIAINAGNLTISGGSALTAGIEAGLGTDGAQAGDIDINSTGTLTVTGRNSKIENSVPLGAVGDTGDITITTGLLFVTERARVGTEIRGRGNGGNVTVNALDTVVLRGVDGTNNATSIHNIVERTDIDQGNGNRIRIVGQGNAGSLTINTGTLFVTNDSSINTSSIGEGNGGNITINARESVFLDGAGGGGNSRALQSRMRNNGGVGNAGNILIRTGTLTMVNRARADARSAGQGNAGNIEVYATDAVSISGIPGPPSSGTIDAGGFTTDTSLVRDADGKIVTGRGGNITVQTGSFRLFDNAVLAANTANDEPGGSIQITANTIEVTSGGRIVATSQLDPAALARLQPGETINGRAGNITINATDSVMLSGETTEVSTRTNINSTGIGGNINIQARSLSLTDSAQISASTLGEGAAGSIRANVESLSITQQARLDASTSGAGNAGDIEVEATDSVFITNTGAISTSATASATGNGGSIEISAGQLLVQNGGVVTSRSDGAGNAGSITIHVHDTLQANNGEISTNSTQASGGDITINAADIRLFDDSDIRTDVAKGIGGGGNITLTADSIIAFDDSDILAFARDGEGGDITLNTPAFFGLDYRPASPGTNPDTLDGNNRVDINASGAVSGVITLPDTSFLQNSFTELPENLIDTDTLIANSCIARSPTQGGSFVIIGSGGLPLRPNDAAISPYPTGTVRPVPSEDTSSQAPSWKLGDPIVEPQGVYQLGNGQLVMSRECLQ